MYIEEREKKLEKGSGKINDVFPGSKIEFKLEFENIANRILDEKSGKFTELNKTNMDTILAPLNAKIEEFNVKSSTDLQDESRFILGLIKTHEGKKIGDLFKAYQDNKGMMTYKTFQRNIAKLEVGGFIETTKTEGGAEGNTTIIHLKKEKKLTDF